MVVPRRIPKWHLARRTSKWSHVAAGAKTYPEGKSQWDAIDKQTTALRGAIATLKFEPPVNKNTWWVNPEEKGWTVSDLQQDADWTLFGSTPEASIDSLDQGVTAALTQQMLLTRQLDDEAARAQKMAERLVEQTGTLGKPFQWLGMDFMFLARWLPLVVGLVMAIAGVWWTQKQAQLIHAYLQFKDTDKDLAAWCKRTRAAPFDRSQPVRSTKITAVLSLGWVGLATIQLCVWGQDSLLFSSMEGLAAALIVAAMLVYRRLALSAAIDSDVPSAANNGGAQPGETTRGQRLLTQLPEAEGSLGSAAPP